MRSAPLALALVLAASLTAAALLAPSDLHAGGVAAPAPLQFTKVWQSPPCPVLYDALVSDGDGDGLTDLVIPSDDSANLARLHVYENTGNNSFDEVWVSPEFGINSVTALAVADLDQDGKKELIAINGFITALLWIFENEGDNAYASQPPIQIYQDAFTCLIPRKLLIADTNGDGRDEVVVIQGGSGSSCNPAIKGVLSVVENGAVVFQTTADTFFVGGAVGDFDGDDHPDIIVTHGGFGGEPLFLDWWEFNDVFYEHRTIDFPGLHGLPTAAAIADVDLDGANEIVMAAVVGGVREVLIIKSPGDNQSELVDVIPFPATSNPLDIAVANIVGSASPEIAVSMASSGGIGQVFLFGSDGDGYSVIYQSGAELEESMSHFRSVELADADADGKPEIIICATYGNKVIILEEGAACIGDVDGDSVVNGADLAALLSQWGPCGPSSASCSANLNGDGVVDGADLANLLANWGPCP